MGPRGTNADLIIPRPDLAPAPVMFRPGPTPSRRQVESMESRHARRRKAAREGALYRQALKKAMRENQRYALETADQNRERDFAHRQAMLAAPIARDTLREDLRMKRGMDPREKMRMAAMEDARLRYLAEQENASRERVAKINKPLSQPDPALLSLAQTLGAAGHGTEAESLLVHSLIRRGAMTPEQGQKYLDSLPAQKLHEKNVRTSTETAQLLSLPAVKNYIKDFVEHQDLTAGRALVGLPQARPGFFGQGYGVGFFGGHAPKPSRLRTMEFLHTILAAHPGGINDFESVKKIAEAIINDPEFYDEFSSDIPWAPGNDRELRDRIIQMLTDPSNAQYFQAGLGLAKRGGGR